MKKLVFNTPFRFEQSSRLWSLAVFILFFLLTFALLCIALLGWYFVNPTRVSAILSNVQSSLVEHTAWRGDEVDRLLGKLISQKPKSDFNPKSADFKKFVQEISIQQGLAPAFVWAVISTESSHDSSAQSESGARGLMQLMPETAGEMGVKDQLDPYDNVKGGVKYLKYLFVEFKGDLRLVLAAYNAGPNEVKKYGGIPPYPETLSYVTKVLDKYESYKNKGYR
jgi:soluble lytic murein transglycosylase-like protein